MGKALLLQFFEQLPEPREGEECDAWTKRLRSSLALKAFKKRTVARYFEGTLQRLLDSSCVQTRQAALVALSVAGSMASNAKVAGALKDEDDWTRDLAADTLWSLWFRADTDAHNRELQRLLRLRGTDDVKVAFETLLKKAPGFAEVYNQRAILHFRLGEFRRAIADCEQVLKLNPLHFAALAGMAQCYMKLRKPRAALKAFRSAYRINPNLEGIEDTIRSIEEMLGEEGKKDDKK